MYIYNVTSNIEDKAHDKWLHWMKNVHIPKVLSTGKFLGAKMTKVLAEEGTGQTYSVQYTVANKEFLDAYYKEDAPKLREEGLKLFADQLISFRTELEVIDEFFVHRNTATHHLFTYGTLQEKEVQLGVFSRLLGGYDDMLHGHKISDIKVAGLYPTLEHTSNSNDQIPGKVYVLTDEELKKADVYEGEAYKRIEVVLNSGKKAWVYLAR